MTRLQKVLLVLGGYVGAVLIAWLAVKANDLWMERAGADTSGGMAAFGDLILFVGTFFVVSIVPTGLAIRFLLQARRRK